jgi:hypothetical protein
MVLNPEQSEKYMETIQYKNELTTMANEINNIKNLNNFTNNNSTNNTKNETNKYNNINIGGIKIDIYEAKNSVELIKDFDKKVIETFKKRGILLTDLK